VAGRRNVGLALQGAKRVRVIRPVRPSRGIYLPQRLNISRPTTTHRAPVLRLRLDALQGAVKRDDSVEKCRAQTADPLTTRPIRGVFRSHGGSKVRAPTFSVGAPQVSTMREQTGVGLRTTPSNRVFNKNQTAPSGKRAKPDLPQGLSRAFSGKYGSA